MNIEKEQLLKISDSCGQIRELLSNEKGNLYKLIKNKKNKFAKVELNQLYEKFNDLLANVDSLNREISLGYCPDEEYISRKISGKKEHLATCFDEYKYSMDSNILCRLKAFWCGGRNLHIGIYVINMDIAFTCSKIQYEISRILESGWEERRWHKYDYHSNNKKLLIYRINKLTALMRLQNMVYSDSRFSIGDETLAHLCEPA